MSGGWNTIESDAGVFTYLLDNLGVKDVQCEELVALDVDLLQQLKSIYGVIFLFKYPTESSSSSAYLADSGPQDGTFDPAAAESLFFAAQTIQNACGTQALLSVLLNKDDEVDVGPQLKEFKEFTAQFPPDIRGEALSNSFLIRTVHNSFARSSPFISEIARDPTVPGEDVYHFIAYTAFAGTLYELDGLQPYPISHGPIPPSPDLSRSSHAFATALVPVLQRRIERYPSGEIRFNLLAVVKDLRIGADAETLVRESEKRKGWQWENALRRWNFVGFVGEVLKGVVGVKVRKGGGAYEKWVQEGVERTKKRREEGRGREEEV